MKKLRVSNKKIDDDLLMKKRREELAKWPTGKEVDFDEAIQELKDCAGTQFDPEIVKVFEANAKRLGLLSKVSENVQA